MALRSLLAASLLTAAASGFKFTHPTPYDSWTTIGYNNVFWTANSSDPDYFNLQLFQYGVSAKQSVAWLSGPHGYIADGISVRQEVLIIVLGCAQAASGLPVGSNYSLMAVSEHPNGTITNLATSLMFQVVLGESTASTGIQCNPSSAGTSSSASFTATDGSSPTSSVSNSQSSAIASDGSSGSQKNTIAIIVGSTLGGVIFFSLAFALYVIYNRRKRVEEVEEFGMKKSITGSPVEIKSPNTPY